MSRPNARSRRGGSDESFRVDASEFKALNDRLKDADKKIARRLRKTLKAAADDTVKAVREKAQEPPPPKVVTGLARIRRRKPTRTRSRGMRAALARATQARLSNSKTRAGLSVVTSQRKMPNGMGPMVKAWNSRRFRHPVFGNRRKWVEQAGTGYFTEALADQRPVLMRNLRTAMDEVAREVM